MPVTPSLLHRLRALAIAGAATLGLMVAAPALAQSIDPNGAPNTFIDQIGQQALEAMKADNAVRTGDPAAVTEVVNRYILPYVNLEKTTRLAAGRHWRQASADQHKRLVEAFKGTLVRTYSSAFRQITPRTEIAILPYRGEADATDTVVRSTISRDSGGPVAVDYRLEKTAQGWKIYDLNVEGIWLIQNYRNQFAQEISANGIDGLINALNQRNQ